MKSIAVVALLALSTGVDGGAVQLTKDNHAARVKGKAVFIKFLAPW